MAQVVQSQEVNTCGHPPVPGGASYVNVTGGLGQRSWVVRYICDTGEDRVRKRHPYSYCYNYSAVVV